MRWNTPLLRDMGMGSRDVWEDLEMLDPIPKTSLLYSSFFFSLLLLLFFFFGIGSDMMKGQAITLVICMSLLLLPLLASSVNGLHFYLEPGKKICFFEDIPKSTHVVGETLLFTSFPLIHINPLENPVPFGRILEGFFLSFLSFFFQLVQLGFLKYLLFFFPPT